MKPKTGCLSVVTAFLALYLVSCAQNSPVTGQGRLSKALGELANANQPIKRFYALREAAKESFNAGNIEEARKYGNELLSLAPTFPNDWNYGNAIHDGNMVLGRIALREEKIEDAKQHLLKAGASPGSPQMDSFGPNVSLAKDLLEKGERETVLKYFDLCRVFWKMGQEKLANWSKEVKDGKVPDFGANLVY